MASYCPICDQPITGRFCRGCGRFVRPVEREDKIIINVSHDPENDKDCDYHGTTADFHEEYHSDAESYSYHENGNPYMHQGDYSGSFNTNFNAGSQNAENETYQSTSGSGAEYSASQSYNHSYGIYEKRRNYKVALSGPVVVAVVIICIVIAIISDSSDDNYYDDDTYDAWGDEIEYVVSDDDYNYYDDSYEELDEEEYKALCKKLGYDEYGVKTFEYHKDAVDSGLEDGAYTLQIDYQDACDRLIEKLAEEDITTEEECHGIYDDSAFLDKYGEETASFMIYNSFSLPDNVSSRGAEGFLYVAGDSLNNLLIEMYADVYTIKDAKTIALAMADAIDADYEMEDFVYLEDWLTESDGYEEICLNDGEVIISFTYYTNSSGEYDDSGYFVYMRYNEYY